MMNKIIQHLGLLAIFMATMAGTEILAATVCIKTPSGACKTYTIITRTNGVDADIIPGVDGPIETITKFGLHVTPIAPPDCNENDEYTEECDDDNNATVSQTITATSNQSHLPSGLLTCADPNHENQITLVLVPRNKIVKKFFDTEEVNPDGSATITTTALDPSDPNYLKNFSLLQKLCPKQSSTSISSDSYSFKSKKEKKDADKKRPQSTPKDFVPCDMTTKVFAREAGDIILDSKSFTCSLPASQCTGNSDDPTLTYNDESFEDNELGLIGLENPYGPVTSLEYLCQETIPSN
jgi:hypothetical protein